MNFRIHLAAVGALTIFTPPPVTPQQLSDVKITSQHFDPATGELKVDLLNTSTKPVLAAYIHVVTTYANGKPAQFDYYFDQIDGVGLQDLQKQFLPNSPAPLTNLQIGPVAPGATHYWMEKFNPIPVGASAAVSAVLFLGGAEAGDHQLANHLHQEHIAMSNEWRHWAEVVSSVNNLNDVKSIAEQARTEQTNPPTRKTHPGVLQVAVTVLSTTNPSASGLTEAQGVAFLKAYFNHMAVVTASEGVQQ